MEIDEPRAPTPLDKYQRVLVIGARIKELQKNAPPLINVNPSDPFFEIARKELDAGLLRHIEVFPL